MSGQEYKFEKLEIYRLALDLVVEVYEICKTFPRSEEFGLTSQVKRAVTSVALNIAEGSAAGGDKEFNRFMNMSVCSLVETKAGLGITVKLGFITEQDIMKVSAMIDNLFFKELAFKKSLSH